MSLPRDPGPAKLCLSVLSARMDDVWAELASRLEDRFGSMDHVSKPFAFTQTTYYDRELGTPIERRMVSFHRPVAMDSLAGIKHWTNALEQAYARDGRRAFNLDPGLVTAERLVLATGKNFAHRIYIGSGLWADLTLIHVRGGWRTLPWTFPDYAGRKMQEELSTIRTLFMTQNKKRKE